MMSFVDSVAFVYNTNNKTVSEIKTNPDIADLIALKERAEARGNSHTVIDLHGENFRMLKSMICR